MYYYYKYNGNRKGASVESSPEFRIMVKHPTLTFDRTEEMGIGLLMYVYLEVFTILKRGFNRFFSEIHIMRGSHSCTKAVLVSKVPIYEFMPDHGIHVCFCRTALEDRGKGYYPTLLKFILEKYPQKDFYMIVEDTNIASIRGIEKVGFTRYAIGEKVGKTFKVLHYV